MEKGEEEGTETEVVEDMEEGGLLELGVPNEEVVRLDIATDEEWYTGSDEERGRGRVTASGLPRDSLQDKDEKLNQMSQEMNWCIWKFVK